MVESIDSSKSGSHFSIDNGTSVDGDETVTELLLDHSLGPGSRVKAMTYCDELEILSLALTDGTVRSFHFNIQINKENEDEEDDEYYEEEQPKKN